jgi:hypothetical protein
MAESETSRPEYVASRYRVGKKIGAGSFGSIHLGLDI